MTDPAPHRHTAEQNESGWTTENLENSNDSPCVLVSLIINIAILILK